jgi:hypothetical protein
LDARPHTPRYTLVRKGWLISTPNNLTKIINELAERKVELISLEKVVEKATLTGPAEVLLL